MRVPVSLTDRFGPGPAYADLLTACALEEGLLTSAEDLASRRFLARSVVPHIETLSRLFNRLDDATPGDQNYWRHASSHSKNLRLAYFLAFLPPNQFRMASVWNELHRLGFRFPEGMFPEGGFRAVELGAGPAAGASGIAAGEANGPLGLPARGEWQLVERDLAALKLGERWLSSFSSSQGLSWRAQGHHRRVELKDGFLPPAAPRFHLWISSFFLNELKEPSDRIAEALSACWERHLEDEGLAILVEPALQAQSRRLLEIRAALLKRWEDNEPKGRKAQGRARFQVLLPCLGHQACGALAKEDDWCHEQTEWWRPNYLRKLDELTGLDRRALPFSYLVVARTRRAPAELLPALGAWPSPSTYRLVSPSHAEGKDAEFYLCGQAGKRRARYRYEKEAGKPQRGDILLEAELVGAPEASRVQALSRIV
ncbi:MAG: hypothetical protein IT285_05335 [Bdellovibrionales bacterium]|nr:hypothetical protein [Bdellovibrionales bacterium]